MPSSKPFQIWGTREAPLNMAYYWSRGQVRELPKFLGKGYSHAFVYFEGEILTWCEDFQDLRTIGRFLLRKFLKNEKELSRIDQEIKRIQDLPAKARKEKERIIKILKPDKKFLKVIKILEKIVVFHDQRKKTILAPFFYLMPLEAEIAKRFKIKRDELVWLIPQEIIRVLKTGKIDLNKIKRRSLKCAFYCDPQKEIIATGREADALIEKWLAKPEEREIKGTVANPGKIQGVVKVVKSIKEIFKIQKGNILVCGMTTPDYGPALKKASAVITDEGGITCHAAIVSRELGIPCIIGTKIATQVLKDGQLVKVDANQGIVRIIK